MFKLIQVMIVLAILGCNSAVIGANLTDLAQDGYAVVLETRVNGEFNGCDFNKKIMLTNRQIFTCRSYNYSYAYMPKVQVIKHVQYGSIKVLINDREYIGDYSGNTLSEHLPGYNVPHQMGRPQQEIQADLFALQEIQEFMNRKVAGQEQIVYENTQEAVDATAAAAYKVFPFLNIGDAKANVDAIEAVRSRASEYISAGYTLSNSLLNAVNDIGPLYDIKNNVKWVIK